MSKPLQQPNLLPVPWKGRTAYMLAEDWSVTWGWSFTLRAGLVVDGASVPRSLWWLFPPDGLYRAAALLHDALYAVKGVLMKISNASGAQLYRAGCDGVFHDMMVEAGVRPSHAWIMWKSVRLFGWRPWGKSSGELTQYQVS